MGRRSCASRRAERSHRGGRSGVVSCDQTAHSDEPAGTPHSAAPTRAPPRMLCFHASLPLVCAPHSLVIHWGAPRATFVPFVPLLPSPPPAATLRLCGAMALVGWAMTLSPGPLAHELVDGLVWVTVFSCLPLARSRTRACLSVLSTPPSPVNDTKAAMPSLPRPSTRFPPAPFPATLNCLWGRLRCTLPPSCTRAPRASDRHVWCCRR